MKITPKTLIVLLCLALLAALAIGVWKTQKEHAPSSPLMEEVRLQAYTTAYGWPDNSCGPNSDQPGDCLHNGGHAGGTGTYEDPITLAVGHVIEGGVDTLDYPDGVLFYIPSLRKYFVVEDSCGDGDRPQDLPCHTNKDEPGYVQVDLWVGGENEDQGSVLKCQDALTGIKTLILNPRSDYPVVPGPLFDRGACATLYE
jgi:hypothetical protein